METFLQDLRFAARVLRKNSGVTAVAVLTLALGIGANTAVFAVLDPLLLRKLPVHNPDELVMVHSAGSLQTLENSAPKTFFQYRAHQTIFSAIGAFSSVRALEVAQDGRSDSARAVLVSGDYFTLLGIPPFAGRLLAPDDERGPSGRPVAVLSFDYWRRQFNSDLNAVGRTVRLTKGVYTVAGIAPPGFFGAVVGQSPDLYLPLGEAPSFTDWVTILGRLKPGGSMQQAQAALEPLFQKIAEESDLPPVERRQAMAQLLLTPAARGTSDLRQQFSLPGRILMAVVALVLLIACANVASLLLSRGFARTREITVRMALGAGRQRLIRQLLTESALLATMGAAAGLLTGKWASGLLVASLSTARSPIVLTAGFTTRIFFFTAAILAACVLLCGLAPALSATRGDLGGRLRTQRAGLGRTFSRSALGKGMVMTQVALSVTLLAGAGLLLHSLVNLETFNVGFDRDNVLAVELQSSGPAYSRPQADSYYSRLLERVQQLPGVRFTGFSLYSPVSEREHGINVAVENVKMGPGDETHVFFNSVAPGYFAAMGIPLLTGRDFSPHDQATSLPVAIINRTMARHYFGDQNPLGRRFKFVEGNRPPMEIIGVTGDSIYNDLREKTPDFVYVNWQQMRGPAGIHGILNVRCDGNARSKLAPLLRDIVPSLDPAVTAASIKSLREHVGETLHQDRVISSLCATFALLALVLTCVGLYGTLATGVTHKDQ